MTAEELQEAFMNDLQELLDKYNAEYNLVASDDEPYEDFIQVTIPIPTDDDELCEFNLPDCMLPTKVIE